MSRSAGSRFALPARSRQDGRSTEVVSPSVTGVAVAAVEGPAAAQKVSVAAPGRPARAPGRAELGKPRRLAGRGILTAAAAGVSCEPAPPWQVCMRDQRRVPERDRRCRSRAQPARSKIYKGLPFGPLRGPNGSFVLTATGGSLSRPGAGLAQPGQVRCACISTPAVPSSRRGCHRDRSPAAGPRRHWRHGRGAWAGRRPVMEVLFVGADREIADLMLTDCSQTQRHAVAPDETGCHTAPPLTCKNDTRRHERRPGFSAS